MILESLYDSLGIGDHAWRCRLSRASDDTLFALAADAGRAVLVNWWHRDTAPARLRQLDAHLVEAPRRPPRRHGGSRRGSQPEAAPARTPDLVDGTGGFGWHMVNDLAHHVVVTPGPEGGKTVRALLPR
ncbi:hypothetical protein [Streptomyces sp. NPDC090131]|uniref:hypothetical protein n=1 Tax=Streptomyces sp. NPDC090131 TaxID=3365954 RepID=UPI00382B42EF